ncbi:Draxin [Manis pentadactyla]|nr:Draxin [Manis pentadactyla]
MCGKCRGRAGRSPSSSRALVVPFRGLRPSYGRSRAVGDAAFLSPTDRRGHEPASPPSAHSSIPPGVL